MRATYVSTFRGRAMAPSAAAFALAALLMPLQLRAQEVGEKLGAVVRGRLVLEGKQQPSDWRVLATPRLFAELPRDAAGRPMGTAPNADGTFALECPDAGLVYVCPYTDGKLAVDSVAPVRLKPGQKQEQELVVKLKPPRAQVAFVLREVDGKPLGRKARAHLYNVYGELYADTGGTWSDDAGVVRYERLPCTSYALWVESPPEDAAPGGERVEASVGRPVAASVQRPVAAALFRGLDVTPGDGTQTIELAVLPSGGVKGRLLRVGGEAPAAQHVVAVQTGTVPEEKTSAERALAAYARGAHDCYAEAEVAADGTFLLADLTPGKHWLDVRRPGQREAWCTIPGVEVKAGQVTELGNVEVAWNGWEYMFDRRTLDGWAESDFWGRKEVRIENDRIVLSMGNDMTGITWKKQLPRVDYEVTLDAMRVAEDDFFCGLTFPVKDDYCSLILGGWGGSVVGLSSLDGYDASENETSQWIQFAERRWYRVRLRVTQNKIEAWLDDEKIVDVATENRDISTRIEVEPSKPFGIATWRTTGAVRDIRMRWLDRPAP